jgi:hypothetical protein
MPAIFMSIQEFNWPPRQVCPPLEGRQGIVRVGKRRDIGGPGEKCPFPDKRPLMIQKNSAAQVHQLLLKTIRAGSSNCKRDRRRTWLEIIFCARRAR